MCAHAIFGSFPKTGHMYLSVTVDHPISTLKYWKITQNCRHISVNRYKKTSPPPRDTNKQRYQRIHTYITKSPVVTLLLSKIFRTVSGALWSGLQLACADGLSLTHALRLDSFLKLLSHLLTRPQWSREYLQSIITEKHSMSSKNLSLSEMQSLIL